MKSYLKDLYSTIVRPGDFFPNLPLSGGVTSALIFVIITQWIAAAFEYLYAQTFTIFATKWLPSPDFDTSSLRHYWVEFQTPFMVWVMSVGKVILNPFFTIFWILTLTLITFIGMQVLVSEEQKRNRPVTFEAVLRVLAYGSGPSILKIIPFFGTGISLLWTFFSTLIGIKESFQLSWGKAAVIKLFPLLLLLATCFFIGMLVLLGLALGLSALFSGMSH